MDNLRDTHPAFPNSRPHQRTSPSRWGRPQIEYTAIGQVWRGTPEGKAQWKRDAEALTASRHEDRRRILDGMPELRAGESIYFRGIGWHAYLLEVAGYGYRLIQCVPDGVHQAWELPGYNADDAYLICKAMVEGYL